MTHRFPLRPDFMAQVVVPQDMTAAEARRLIEFIATLVRPITPSPTTRDAMARLYLDGDWIIWEESGVVDWEKIMAWVTRQKHPELYPEPDGIATEE